MEPCVPAPKLLSYRMGTLEAWGSVHETAVLLSLAGRERDEIAETLGRSIEWVNATLEDQRALLACEEIERRVVEQVAARGSEVQMKLRALAGEALDELLELMKMSESESIRLKSATAILDRAGFTAVQRSINLGTQIPSEVADRLEETLREMSSIEADYEILPIETVVDA